MTGSENSDEMRAAIREVLRELTDGNGNGHGNGSGRGNGSGHGNGSGKRSTGADDAAPVPQVPAPPVAAVIRPSTWDRPPAPGEVIGGATPAPTSAPASAPTRTPAPGVAEPSPRREGLRAAFNDAEFRASAPPPSPSAPPEVRSSAPAHPGDARREVVTMNSDEDLEQFVRDLMSRLENPRERLAIRTGRLRFRLHHSPAPAPAAAASSGPVTRVERGAVTERMIRAAAADGTRLVLAPGAVLTPLAREQARARGVEIERERRC